MVSKLWKKKVFFQFSVEPRETALLPWFSRARKKFVNPVSAFVHGPHFARVRKTNIQIGLAKFSTLHLFSGHEDFAFK